MTFGYDAIGRLTSVNDSVGGTITWVYDTVASGHHPRVAETTSTGTVTVEYDEIGRRFKLSATGQSDTTYGYDAASQFQTVTKGTQTVTLAYDDAGRRTSLTYPNGVVTSYGYDNANRVLSITHVKAPTTIESLTYTYDPTGNRLSQTRANAAASNLPTAVAAAQITYDAANELLRWNNATNNLTYDNNGNLATETVGGVMTTYTWDSRNRLTGISKTGLTASFVYDGLGRRKSKTVNGSTTGFWYDGNDVYAELSGVTPSFTYIRGLNIDEPYVRKGASDEFYETDALGSSVALTNSAGAAQTTYTYEPFGTTTQAGTASTSPFQFTGRENDGTGLYYYRARYYYPKVQRFVRQDPIEFRGGDWNIYAYAAQDPISLRDPFGLLGYGGAAALGCTAGALGGIGGRKPLQGAILGGFIGCNYSPLMIGLQLLPTYRGLSIGLGAYIGAVSGAATAAAQGGTLSDIALGTAGGLVGGAISGAISNPFLSTGAGQIGSAILTNAVSVLGR
ncbi:MAG: RHS repeat-associated core domain-containing protein [Nitrospira sp.]